MKSKKKNYLLEQDEVQLRRRSERRRVGPKPQPNVAVKVGAHEGTTWSRGNRPV